MIYRKNIARFTLSLAIALLSLILDVRADEVYVNTITLSGATLHRVSQDGNALYMATSTRRIYRYNFTKFLSTQDFIYSTSHTGPIRAIGISKGQYYFATGSEDNLIEVVLAYTQVKVCTLEHYNQIRALEFDPNIVEVLYAASVDDTIRKWNVTTCKLMKEIDIGYSINVMSINDAGTKLAYGCLYGQVGYIDTDLTTAVTKTTGHAYTVLYIFWSNNDYYATIADDAAGVLWNNGIQINRFVSPTVSRFVSCSLWTEAVYNDTMRLVSCTDDNRLVKTMSITNTTFKQITSHGFSKSIAVMVNKYIGYSQMMWILFFTDGTVNTHYLYDSQTSVCSPHYGLNIPTKICMFCFFILEGCHFCDDNTKCTTCATGYYSAGGGLCGKCPDQCLTCSSTNNCNTCAPGYEELGSSGKCSKSLDTGCFYYSKQNNCNEAVNGYYIKSTNDVRLCSDRRAGCLECRESNGDCFTCETGYYVSNFDCVDCNAAMPGCLACSNSTMCLHCSVAFRMYGSNRQCSNCHGTCATCGPYYDNCLTCYPAQQRTLEDTSCNCNDGYYDKQASNNFTCGLCSSVLTNCYLCDTATTCLQCQPFYYFVTNGAKKECEVCSKYCQTCNVDSDVCATCNSVTYHRVLSGTDCVCETGFVMILDSVPCSNCSIINVGCLACSNTTMCSSCDSMYYLKVFNASTHLCEPCPYYCPDCALDGSGAVVCSNCVPGSHRTLSASGMCECDVGYFDDNSTAACQKCSDVLTNCLQCTNRTRCQSCAPGMFSDPSGTVCAACRPTCQSCGAYFDQCASCDPSSNRILVGNKCACQPYAYEDSDVCVLCSSAIPNCNSCENPYLCTGCQTGYTLQSDLKACIDCQGSMNGCFSCTSVINCTTCIAPFTLINDRCRCPLTMYTQTDQWGSCVNYGIPGLQSSLGIQLQAHQHQNNTLIVFIRFRAETLYVLNQPLKSSISMKINGAPVSISFSYINNNRIHIQTQLTSELVRPNITVVFSPQVFFNQDLLTIGNLQKTISPTRLYHYSQSNIKTTQALKKTITFILYILKWVFFGMSIIGMGHILFPFVIFISLMPIFLMLNMSLPSNLSCVLEGFLSFQVKAIVPLMELNSDYFVTFPPMTYDYYRLLDYFVLCKLGDLLTILLVNVMTKFDQGIIRMFPPGRIRRYLYESLVRRGYAVMSLCILSFQPALILLASVYINYSQWQNVGEIFNYCCCVFMFGFYLAYNFNHASNLQGTKKVKNIQNQHCFNGINSQDSAAPRTTLFVLASDFWIVGAVHLVGPMPYFVSSIFFLLCRIVMHVRPNFYSGKIQFSLRILECVLLLGIFCIMLVFYLGESKITLTFEVASKLGLAASIMMVLFLAFTLAEKIIYQLKLETDWVKTKQVEGKNAEGQEVIFAQRLDQNEQGEEEHQGSDDRDSRKMQFLAGATAYSNAGGGFKGRNFGRTQKQDHDDQQDEIDNMNDPKYNNQSLNIPSNGSNYNSAIRKRSDGNYNNRSLGPNLGYSDNPNGTKGTGDFFNNTMKQKQKQKQIRIKSANTSKYAQNHLELRYKAQNMLTKNPDNFDLQ